MLRDERTRESVSTNFREFVRPNSSSAENFRRQLSRVQIHPVYIGAADRRRFSAGAALYLSKYRLTLRATLLVWPRTSLLIISHGLSIQSSSSLLVFPFPSFPPPGDASFGTLGVPRGGHGRTTSFYFSNVASSRLYTLSVEPRRRKNMEYLGLSAPESNCLYAGGDSQRGNDRQLLRIGNSAGAVSEDDVTSGKVAAILGNTVRRVKVHACTQNRVEAILTFFLQTFDESHE